MKIDVGDSTRAFMKGVSAGVKAGDALEGVEASFDQRSSFYWLHVGLEMAGADVAGEEAQSLFVQGATTRAPQRTGVLVEFATDSAAFGDSPDPLDEVATHLLAVSRRVREGYPEGEVMDRAGHSIGRFTIEGVG